MPFCEVGVDFGAALDAFMAATLEELTAAMQEFTEKAPMQTKLVNGPSVIRASLDDVEASFAADLKSFRVKAEADPSPGRYVPSVAGMEPGLGIMSYHRAMPMVTLESVE